MHTVYFTHSDIFSELRTSSSIVPFITDIGVETLPQ